MALSDSAQLRELLSHAYPDLEIQEVLRPSGQRVVYFCHFCRIDEDGVGIPDRSPWGNVVLKVSADVHPSVIARIEKEREILDGLDSVYFPKLKHYDVLTSDPVTESKLDQRLFVTIEERIPGEPLSACAHRFARESEALKLLECLVNGLALLWEHPQRIIHRDLKPDNIIIRPDGTPAIIDLGIVREQGTVGVTASFAHFGPCTPGYASPEQLKNDKRNIDYRADFFALGVVFYELLSGQNPFIARRDEPVESVVDKALTLIPEPLVKQKRAGERLSSLIDGLLAKEPYKRPRTVQILAQEIDAIIEAGHQ